MVPLTRIASDPTSPTRGEVAPRMGIRWSLRSQGRQQNSTRKEAGSLADGPPHPDRKRSDLSHAGGGGTAHGDTLAPAFVFGDDVLRTSLFYQGHVSGCFRSDDKRILREKKQACSRMVPLTRIASDPTSPTRGEVGRSVLIRWSL